MGGSGHAKSGVSDKSCTGPRTAAVSRSSRPTSRQSRDFPIAQAAWPTSTMSAHPPPGRDWNTASFGLEGPAYRDEVKGLGFLIVVMGDRLAGFAGGLVVGVWGLRCWRGRGP